VSVFPESEVAESAAAFGAFAASGTARLAPSQAGFRFVRQAEAGQRHSGQAGAESLQRLSPRGRLGQSFGQLIELITHVFPSVLLLLLLGYDSSDKVKCSKVPHDKEGRRPARPQSALRWPAPNLVARAVTLVSVLAVAGCAGSATAFEARMALGPARLTRSAFARFSFVCETKAGQRRGG
jgi:hypothetical protein